MIRKIAFALFIGLSCFIQGQTVSGVITDEQNIPLPFAHIYVSEAAEGAISSENGTYQVQLNPGTYTLSVQYIGYETIEKKIVVNSDQQINFQLKAVDVKLNPIQVFSSGEDPAIAVMRKAIAKAPYHLNQIDAYTARVYVKGTGKLNKIPRLLQGQMKKEGIDTTTTYITETISEVNYKRPNTYRENVISFQANGDADFEPLNFAMASFYEPELFGITSPLSPKAFKQYDFKMEAYFEDNGRMINQIAVIPKRNDPSLFKGTIYILDDYWSLNKLDLDFVDDFTNGKIQQVYHAIQPGVFLPVQMRLEAYGSFMGFKFKGQYVSNVDNYEIELNPLLPLVIIRDDDTKAEIKTADEKLEVSEPQILTSSTKSPVKTQVLSPKSFENLMKDFEKQDTVEAKYVIDFTQEVDSNAHKIDTLLWKKMRPIELSEAEKTGYKMQDSIRQVQDAKEEEKGPFSGMPLMNATISGEKLVFSYVTPIILYGFNPIEGHNFGTRMTLATKGEKSKWKLKVEGRYGEAWRRFQFKGGLSFEYKDLLVEAQGGRWMSQLNQEQPVSEFSNTLSCLFFYRNHLVQYEKEFAQLDIRWGNKKKLTALYDMRYESRLFWRNFTNQTFFPERFSERGYQSEVVGADYTVPIQYYINRLKLIYRPGLKFRRFNNEVSTINGNRTAAFFVQYEYGKGLNGMADYDRLEAGFRYTLKLSPSVQLRQKIVGGMSFSEAPERTNWQYFVGEQFPFTGKIQDFYRVMPFYDFNSRNQYLEHYLTLSMENFLLTRISKLRFMGIKEELFLNTLFLEGTPYMEAGYGLNLLNSIGVDFTYSNQKVFGVRIKIRGFENLFD